MGLTTERKIFLGLACVAGLALVIDQGVWGPKQASSESVLEGSGPSSSPSTGESVAVSSPHKPTSKSAAMILIDRIESLGESKRIESLGSSFSLTRFVEPSPGLPITDGASVMDADEDGLESFPLLTPPVTDLPILSSVMPTQAGGGGAVLDGKLLRVGQVDPNGYRLVLVHARAVLVERGGVQYAIEIPLNSGQE